MKAPEIVKVWIARDYNGSLWLHTTKPHREGWVWQSNKCIELPKGAHHEVTWEGKPVEVTI